VTSLANQKKKEKNDNEPFKYGHSGRRRRAGTPGKRSTGRHKKKRGPEIGKPAVGSAESKKKKKPKNIHVFAELQCSPTAGGPGAPKPRPFSQRRNTGTTIIFEQKEGKRKRHLVIRNAWAT